jgi:hypothetical protein
MVLLKFHQTLQMLNEKGEPDCKVVLTFRLGLDGLGTVMRLFWGSGCNTGLAECKRRAEQKGRAE